MQAATAPLPIQQNSSRVESIDLLRGLVMIIMALDHVRDYFHYKAMLFDPTDLAHTSVILFFTRFITHYCAPIFMFLSGTSAWLVGKRKGKPALAKFLLTRGLWLVILELTVVNFGWYFKLPPSSIDFLVIWALGISMIFLSALIYLPFRLIVAISLIMVFGHNLLDPIHVKGSGIGAVLWSMIHEQNFFQFKNFNSLVGYPIVPWVGVMALGYCLGKLYDPEIDREKRKKWLLRMGVSAILLFIVIRSVNIYGDPAPWSQQANWKFTVLSFLNVSKYPPSLLYLLVTLGPALVLLSFFENIRSGFAEKIKVIGRVPMFYYLVHLYLLHLAALFATLLCSHQPADMILDNWVQYEPKLKGYGFSLGVTYVVWAGLIIILYFLCRWYDRYKRTHRYWWLSYL